MFKQHFATARIVPSSKADYKKCKQKKLYWIISDQEQTHFFKYDLMILGEV
jgi:hypothetical protein